MAVTVSRDVTVLRRLRSVLLTIVIILQSRVDGNVTNCRGGYDVARTDTNSTRYGRNIARVTERLVAYGRLGFFLNPTACGVWTDVARRDQTHRVVTESNGCLKKFGIFFLRNYTDKKERVGRENRFATVGKFPFLLRPYRAHVQTSRPTTGANHSPYETRLFPTRPIFQQYGRSLKLLPSDWKNNTTHRRSQTQKNKKLEKKNWQRTLENCLPTKTTDKRTLSLLVLLSARSVSSKQKNRQREQWRYSGQQLQRPVRRHAPAVNEPLENRFRHFFFQNYQHEFARPWPKFAQLLYFFGFTRCASVRFYTILQSLTVPTITVDSQVYRRDCAKVICILVVVEILKKSRYTFL